MSFIKKRDPKFGERGDAAYHVSRITYHGFLYSVIRNTKYVIRKPARSAFTLIELLVAMGLFLVVVIIASGTFIQALRSQRATVEFIAVNDNINLTLEQMAREIRVGENFSHPSSDSLQFTNSAGKVVVYRLNSGVGIIEKSIGGGSFEAVTATNVAIRRLAFIVAGIGVGDGLQPRITIAISAGGRTKSLEGTVTNLETTVSPRILES